MACRRAPCNDLGSVKQFRGGFIARVRSSGRAGVLHEVCGPWRCDENQAEDDLARIRSSAGGPSRQANLKQMAKTAAQLKAEVRGVAARALDVEKQNIHRSFRAGRAAESHCLANSGSASSSGAQGDPALDEDSYYESVSNIGDVNEPWQDMEVVEDDSMADLFPTPPRTRQYDALSTMVPANAEEATEALRTLLPSRSTTEDIELLLERRADPNVTGAGGYTILNRVIHFASPGTVIDMRAALLTHGAIQSDADIAYWERRQRADEADQVWLHKFHDDDRTARYYE